MLILRPSQLDEAGVFVQMEKREDTSAFIIPYSEAKHKIEMQNNDIEYLSIYQQQKLIGFIILSVKEIDRVEFRRIVIAEKGQGFGQDAMRLMERYCKQTLRANAVWLDVFATNSRGIHIYQKLGYKQFQKGEFQGRHLLIMEKKLT